jgi:hypothetical protein
MSFQMFADPTELFPTLADIPNVQRVDYAITATVTVLTGTLESTVRIELPITKILTQKEATA